jgi:hypothetical protein
VIIQAIVLAAGVFATPVADFDIPWYQANPAARRDALVRCHNDQRLADTPECRNAELAGTREFYKQFKPFDGRNLWADPQPRTKRIGHGGT